MTEVDDTPTGAEPVPRYALELAVVVLLLLWLFGAFISPVGGRLIHLLLVVLLVAVVMRLVMGRRAPG